MSSLTLSIKDCVLLEKSLLAYRGIVPFKDPENELEHIRQLLGSIRSKRRNLERGGIE